MKLLNKISNWLHRNEKQYQLTSKGKWVYLVSREHP